MSTLYKEEDSEDEFESADEGEPSTPPPSSSSKVTSEPEPIVTLPSPSPVKVEVKPVKRSEGNDGWGDWNIDDEEPIELPKKNVSSPPTESASSLSSSISKTGDNTSQVVSDDENDDEQTAASNQQRLQKKKYRKKSIESNWNKEETKANSRPSRPTERRDEETKNSSLTSSVSSNIAKTTEDSTTTGKHNVKDAHHVLDRLAAQSPTRAPSWSSPWGNFGSLLSTAKQSVSTLTSTVSEGFSAVIETVEAGLGAPDPQKLAEMNQMAFKIKGETSDSEDEPETSVNTTDDVDSVINQDGWLNSLTFEKLTTTGMKVVSGSLDVLETVGRKTFDVINEADPELKGARRLLTKKTEPTLSEIIRQAQQDKPNETSTNKNEMATFFQLFEKHQGLVHFEALELLSNQSSLVFRTMNATNEALLVQIDEYFQLDDDDLTLSDENETSTTIDDHNHSQIPTLDVLSQKFTAYQSQLRSTIPVDKLLEVYESANQFLQEWDWMDTELDQKTLADEAIDSLAILCARIIEYYHKTAQLFLMGCKSLTSFSIDIELLAIYKKQQDDFSKMLAGIPHLFARSMKQISNLPATPTSTTADLPVRCDSKFKQKLLNQMFIQSSSSQTYASDAYLLLKPIISQSILYHRSTTR